jgi:urea carboxylase-associated protein 2
MIASATATPLEAREHARAQAGAIAETMPTLPASRAKDLPPYVKPSEVVWDETIPGGGYASRVLKHGTRLRLVNLKGDACCNLLVYNADRPIERLNVADTVKVQWNAYLAEGKLLLSDMGRALMSIVEDTCGHHDALCGASNRKTNAAKYGTGGNYTPHPNARERFLIALAKHGLGKADVMPNVNLFKSVRVERDGELTFINEASKAGDVVELRAEMNVLVVIANTPHVLDPRERYTCTPLRITAYRGALAGPDDPIRNASPEAQRAFLNNDDYFLS